MTKVTITIEDMPGDQTNFIIDNEDVLLLLSGVKKAEDVPGSVRLGAILYDRAVQLLKGEEPAAEGNTLTYG